MFTLFEEFLLLSIHEAKGTIFGSKVNQFKSGLVGAILAELALVGRIQTTSNHRLQIIDNGQMEDDVLNESLRTLAESGKDHKFGYWINALNNKPERFRRQIAERLIQKGVFTQDDDRLVWVAPSPLQAEVKASTKYWVIKRLRGIVLAQEDNQTRDIVLLCLVRACGLLDLVFLRDERKIADRYIYEQLFSQAVREPVIQTVQEIETAIAALVEED